MLELRALPTDCAQRRQESVCVGCGARAFSVCSSLDPADLAGLDAIAAAAVNTNASAQAPRITVTADDDRD